MTLGGTEIAPEIEPLSLLRTLGYPDAQDVVKITGGWETLLWRFRDTAGDLRSLRVYWVSDREESSRKEAVALRHCEAVGFSAPRVKAVRQVDGLPVTVLSWVPGAPVLADLERRPWRLGRLSRLMGVAQARLHSLAPPVEFEAGAPESWTRLIEAGYQHLADELIEQDLATSVFIHMDFHPLNILALDGRFTGVVDWAGAAAGDRRADLARTEVTMATAPIPPGPMRPVLAVLRRLMLRGWREGYRSAAGSIPDYRPFRRWAAASLLREVSRVMGRPGVWAEPGYVQQLHDIAGGARPQLNLQVSG